MSDTNAGYRSSWLLPFLLNLRTRKGAIRQAKSILSRYDPEYGQVLQQLRAAATELGALRDSLPADSLEKGRASIALDQVQAAIERLHT